MLPLVSCLPGLLAQLGFAHNGNPGDIPASALAVMGALAIREAQLDNANQRAANLETALVEDSLIMAAAAAENESLKARLRIETSRNIKLRSDMWTVQDNLRDARRAHDDTKIKLAATEERLATIVGAVNGTKKDEPEGEAGAAAVQH